MLWDLFGNSREIISDYFSESMSLNYNTGVCKACNTASKGNYCPQCGQSLSVKRLSMRELLHEAFHFFTHVEKGFLYTVKMLLVSPGKAQKEYIQGNRVRHQKPFSMFFIAGTISALVYYWLNRALMQYFHAGSSAEASFFQQYWVLLQICMLPLYGLIVYLCFKKAGYNYGEIIVSQLYTFSFLFLLLALLQLSKLFYHTLETRYIELPLILAYTLLTNLTLFNQLKKGSIVILTILAIVACFVMAAFVQDKLIEVLY